VKSYAIDGAKLAPEPKPPAQDVARHTPKAAANHLSVAEQKKHDERRVDEDAASLDRMLAAGKRLDPPGRKPRRVWERMFNQIAENCEQCGRIIEPGAERYQDWVSGHLRRHVECHEKAEGA
jgi:hypothetical protein